MDGIESEPANLVAPDGDHTTIDDRRGDGSASKVLVVPRRNT